MKVKRLTWEYANRKWDKKVYFTGTGKTEVKRCKLCGNENRSFVSCRLIEKGWCVYCRNHPYRRAIAKDARKAVQLWNGLE